MTTTTRAVLGRLLPHLLTPLVLCLGMGLAYLSAFTNPTPRELPVALVGAGPQTHAIATALATKAGEQLDVHEIPDRREAEKQLRHHDIAGAYVIDQRTPELLVASAASEATARAARSIFTPLAAQQGATLKVTDVVPPASGDPIGQGIFFLMVAISIGSYASVAVVGAAGTALPMAVRVLLGLGMSLGISVLGTLLAGPLFHLVPTGLAGAWLLMWCYSAGILLIGLGLHTFLQKWTTLALTVLFVMLNFPSSGGVLQPEFQNGFFATLHGFWNGAAFIDSARSIVYFHDYDLTRHVWTLIAWLIAGIQVIALAWISETRGQARTAAPGRPPAPDAEPAGADAAREELTQPLLRVTMLPARQPRHAVDQRP